MSQLAAAPSKIIHHGDTEHTEFWFPRSFLSDLRASVVDFIPMGGSQAHVALRMAMANRQG